MASPLDAISPAEARTIARLGSSDTTTRELLIAACWKARESGDGSARVLVEMFRPEWDIAEALSAAVSGRLR